MQEKTWEQLKETEVGTILHDEMQDGLRFIVTRGPGSLCGYIGVPLLHPLSGHSYEDVPVNAHGGLTFSGKGDETYRPKGYWWYGWDYAHSGDVAFYDSMFQEGRDKQWLVEDVVKDSWEAIYEFKQLLRLAESIYNKVMKWREVIENIEEKENTNAN